MNEKVKAALKRYQENQYATGVEGYVRLEKDAMRIADWVSEQYSDEPLTVGKAEGLGATYCSGILCWELGGGPLELIHVNYKWAAYFVGGEVKPVRTVGDLQRLLDCLGFERQEGGEG